MTVNFPKNQKVFVQDRSFCDLIVAITTTVDHHLQFVDDLVTRDQWNELEYNGIRAKDSLTVHTVARMLNITDTSSMEIGNVLPALFTAVPVLRNYWEITKLNAKSAYVRRLNSNMTNLLKQFEKPPSVEPTPAKLTQTTLQRQFNSVKAPNGKDSINNVVH